MKLITDFHIHSRFSRATSQELSPEEIDYWARIKGIQIVGTGDFTHPEWRKELAEKLIEAEPGLYQLKEKYQIKNRLLPAGAELMRFVFSAEISCIYKKTGLVRKLHHLILAPGLESAERISRQLSKIGNLKADGRPILGIDSKHLLEMLLETDESAVLIPAHIWTPWFSLFGSMSGFNTIEECFEELTNKIFALETGLSSDPKMNWRLSSLDRFTLVSNSDAHSPKNLAREACIFDCNLDYNSLISALKDPSLGYLGTIEFFPEEGKYHYDGHRKCQLRFSPQETKKHQGICPVCQKPLTIGVMNRVEELADRMKPEKPNGAPGYQSLIPLAEVLGEILETGAQARRVEKEYFRLIKKIGPELFILREAPFAEIEKISPVLALAIERMRKGEVKVEAGYDGEYGTIRVFDPEELKRICQGQKSFFAEELKKEKTAKKEKNKPEVTIVPWENSGTKLFSEIPTPVSPSISELDPLQKKAVQSQSRILVIQAGPGTGKTKTLTHRIAYLIENHIALPSQVLALTFTNQSAKEMKIRLHNLIGEDAEQITIKTIHSYAYQLLKEQADFSEKFFLIDDETKMVLLEQIMEEMTKSRIRTPTKSRLKKIADIIRLTKNYLIGAEELHATGEFAQMLAEIYRRYQARLTAENYLDFDELIFQAVKLLTQPEIAEKIRKRFSFIFVDEFQDLDFAQYQLIKLLVGETGWLSVIGDPDQAIYGFRGASPEFFLRLPQDLPEAEIIQLQRCFRCSDQILKPAQLVLTRDKSFLSSGISGPKVKMVELPSEGAEAEFIAQEIEKIVGGVGFFSFDSARVESELNISTKSFSEIAVLFRTSAQIAPLQEAFSRLGIPYQVFAESPLKSKFFRLCLWALQILSGSASSFLLKLVLSEIFPEERSFPDNLKNLESWLQQKTNCTKAKELLDLLQKLSGLNPKEILNKIFLLLENERENPENEMVKEMVLDLTGRWSKEHPSAGIKDLWEMLSLASPQDFYDPRADRVSLLTIHSAKGLEFEVVFLVGLEQGILPHISARSTKEKNEEARLFYVAMTRAKKLLYLSYTRKRTLHNQVSAQIPSRFLERIPSEFLEPIKPELKPAKPKAKQMKLF